MVNPRATLELRAFFQPKRRVVQLSPNLRKVTGYIASGVVVGALLTIQSELGYPRTYNLVVLGIYDLFLVIHLTVVSSPAWLLLFVPLALAEIWI